MTSKPSKLNFLQFTIRNSYDRDEKCSSCCKSFQDGEDSYKFSLRPTEYTKHEFSHKIDVNCCMTCLTLLSIIIGYINSVKMYKSYNNGGPLIFTEQESLIFKRFFDDGGKGE